LNIHVILTERRGVKYLGGLKREMRRGAQHDNH
jgi:hypothetical protein